MNLGLAILCFTGVAVVFNLGVTGEINKGKSPRLLVGGYSTRTYVSLTTITSTVPSTCYNNINTAVCKKRKRRNHAKLVQDITNYESSMTDLNSSNNFPPVPGSKEKTSSNRQGRLKITFWSTVTSSYTYISTTYAATTFSVSYICSVAGFSYPPSCG